MDIQDGADKVGEVLSFQLVDVSKREGENGNREWTGIRKRGREEEIGLDSRLPPPNSRE